MYSVVNQRPCALTDTPFTYCPGCGHGIAQRLIAEAIDELGIRERTVGVWPVGCSVFSYEFFNIDGELSSHGRAPAVATGAALGLRLTKPDAIVFTYQGDGDLASIGFNEILHAANRGWGITVFFINNGTYGMTGGQLAPTSLVGQHTATSPEGRNAEQHGCPIPVCEILARIKTPAFITRVSVFDAKRVLQAKKAIRKAFETQINHKGFAFVEILSSCPTDWDMTPSKAMEHIEREVLREYPLGVIKDIPESSAEKIREIPPNIEPEEDRSCYVRPKSSKQWNVGSEEMLIAGFGGQGILAAGDFIAYAANAAGKHASWVPSYGPEMRGGTANCSVIFSDEEIASPIIENPTALLVMNRPSFDAYVPLVKPNGILVVNSSLVDSKTERADIRVAYVTASQIANELGDQRVANVVMLGAYAAVRGLDPEDLLPGIRQELAKKKDLIPVNVKALKRGYASALKQNS